MADLETIISNIIRTIKDPSFTEDDIISYMNAGMRYIANNVLLSRLETTNTVDTVVDDYKVDIPPEWNYQRNIFDCQVVDSGNITVLNSIEHLDRRCPNFRTDKNNGPIQYIVYHKNQIIYYPIPSDITSMDIGYFELPIPVTETDALDVLPIGLQEILLESYVNAYIFNRKEDGIDEIKINTRKYEKAFNLAMETLEDTTDVGQSRKIARSVTSWI